MSHKTLGPIFCLICTGTNIIQAKEFCFGVNNEQYRCEMGYCCGETECCTYYYELWWFWLVWTLIIMLSCCCAYRHRRVKMRLQQEQRQREISLMAYQGASTSLISPLPLNLRFWTDCKLPDYEEVAGHPPTPPPPYCEANLEVSPAEPTVSVVLALPVENQSAQVQADNLPARVEDPVPPSQGEEPPSDTWGEAEEEPATRRRHVTGDSGIEVCVCQLDVDDDDDEEEEEEEEQQQQQEERLCQGAGGNCCSDNHSSRLKEWSSQSQPAGSSSEGAQF